MESAEYFRSGELIGPSATALVLVDVQEKLLPAIRDSATLEWNLGRLIDACQLFGVPVVATEQYPQGLGRTVPGLANRLQSVLEKTSFSCMGSEAFSKHLREQNRPNVLVVGIETHVCVLQTTLDMLAEGYRVFLPVDAVGSRHKLDHEVALRRLETSGVNLTTTETTLFEWCQDASSPEFKALRRLVMAPSPNT